MGRGTVSKPLFYHFFPMNLTKEWSVIAYTRTLTLITILCLLGTDCYTRLQFLLSLEVSGFHFNQISFFLICRLLISKLNWRKYHIVAWHQCLYSRVQVTMPSCPAVSNHTISKVMWSERVTIVELIQHYFVSVPSEQVFWVSQQSLIVPTPKTLLIQEKYLARYTYTSEHKGVSLVWVLAGYNFYCP